MDISLRKGRSADLLAAVSFLSATTVPGCAEFARTEYHNLAMSGNKIMRSWRGRSDCLLAAVSISELPPVAQSAEFVACIRTEYHPLAVTEIVAQWAKFAGVHHTRQYHTRTVPLFWHDCGRERETEREEGGRGRGGGGGGGGWGGDGREAQYVHSASYGL